MSARPVVGVLGHYGNRNLGDEAIVTATIAHVRQRLKNAEIVCFSFRPNDTAFRHNVESFSVCYLPQFPDPVFPTEIAKAADVPWRAPKEGTDSAAGTSDPAPASLKNRLKAAPVVGPAATVAARVASKLIGAFSELKFTVRAARYLRRCDLLIVAGSNQFLDNFGGTWGFPFTLLRWSLLCRLTGTKIAFVSVGAGPLEGRMSRLFVRLAVRLADYASYRDEPSKALVESGWPNVDCPVFPDLAFGLSSGSLRREPPEPRRKPVVGINPMPVYDSRYWFEHDEVRYREYVEKIAAFSARLIRSNYPVFFFPTMWRDEDVIRDVQDLLRSQHDLHGNGDTSYVRPCEHVHELISAIHEADIIVSTRFHGVVLPYSIGVPVLGIGYYRKTLALMAEMGQEAYHLALDDTDAQGLWTKFIALESNWAVEQRKVAATTAEYRSQVAAQWDLVTALVRSGRHVRTRRLRASPE